MINRILLLLLGISIGFGLYYYNLNKDSQSALLRIPLVLTNLPPVNSGEPIAKRDNSVIYYLQSSVKIRSGNSIGSGTICYFDANTNEAYVISCGHLFNGSKTPTQPVLQKAKIIVFYKNKTKLDSPQEFAADLICFDNKEDISLLKFQPDWKIEQYFAIAPLSYNIMIGGVYESTGCDQNTPTAAYTVTVTSGNDLDSQNLVTKNNSPRPGRSGGGLLTSDGYYIAIVWGTSSLDGSGYGFYVPLWRIHAYISQYPECQWLLNIPPSNSVLNQIPIIDQSGTPLQVPPGYLPQP